MKRTIGELQEKLNTFRPAEWDQIPDIDLYKDQIVGYMERQHLGFELNEDEAMTPAMLNNYIKANLLPRARGKRYTREHIGYLTLISLFKQVLSVNDTGILTRALTRDEEIETLYERFRETLGREYAEAADRLPPEENREGILALAMELAVSSYAERLVCEQLVRMLEDD